MSDHSNLLDTFYHMEERVESFDIFPLGEGYAIYNENESTVYNNHYFTLRKLSNAELEEVEAFFKEKNRLPAIISPKDKEEEVFSEISKQGYQVAFSDAALVYSGETLERSALDGIKVVDSEEELEIFLKTYNRSFQKDDPINPYGEVTDYLPSMRSGWKNNREILEYLIAYDGVNPVATSSLCTLNGYGNISAIGSNREVRGKGFGKEVTLAAVYLSQKKQNKITFLMTETDSHAYNFYLKLGFEKKFDGVCYQKKN